MLKSKRTHRLFPRTPKKLDCPSCGKVIQMDEDTKASIQDAKAAAARRASQQKRAMGYITRDAPPRR